jgi:hypothetical protein
MPEVVEDSNELSVPLARVFSCSSENHLPDFLRRGRSADFPSAVHAVELLRDQASVPAENGVGCDDRGDLIEDFSTQRFAEFSENPTFVIVQTYSTLDLALEDLVLCLQKVDLASEFLIKLAGDCGEEGFPGHGCFLSRFSIR